MKLLNAVFRFFGGLCSYFVQRIKLDTTSYYCLNKFWSGISNSYRLGPKGDPIAGGDSISRDGSSSFILRSGNWQQANREKQREICIHPAEFLYPVEIYRYRWSEATVIRSIGELLARSVRLFAGLSQDVSVFVSLCSEQQPFLIGSHINKSPETPH